MRVVTLSDHAAERIQKAQDLRRDLNDSLMAHWQAAVGRPQAGIDAYARAMQDALARRRAVATTVSLACRLGVQISKRPAMPPLLEAGAEEGRLRGGQEGEARVLASLSQLFDDRWVAFKGYCNRGGETDLLLVGPTAVVALEVKYRNGVVHCEGDAWTCDKSGRHGNVERAIPVRDANGRSPGQQVNATAGELQAQLARGGFPVQVRRAVVLAHDASRIGRMSEPGVEFVGVLADPAFQTQLLGLVQPTPGRPDFDVEGLEQVVRRDHEYHVRAKVLRAIARSAAAPGSPPRPFPSHRQDPELTLPAAQPNLPTSARSHPEAPGEIRHASPPDTVRRTDPPLGAFRARAWPSLGAGTMST